MFSIVVLFFFIAIPVSAEEYPVINTSYTYIDAGTCDVFTYPSTDQFSHLGLSKGEVAYSKDKDPFVYIWNSETGEIESFDTTEIAEENDNWISFWMEIQCLDISNGIAYYSLNIHKTTTTGTSASPKGLFRYDGLKNENVEYLSDHCIDDLLADNNLVLMKDSWYDPESFSVLDKLRIYSSDSDELIAIDNRTDISDLIGFGKYKVVTLAQSLYSHMPGDRIKKDGIAVFDLKPALTGGPVKEIKIPDATDISSNEQINVDQDCFSDNYFVWTKGIKTTDVDKDKFQCTLYATDLGTLENTALDSKADLSFGLYSYAVDGDYLIYKNEERIFLYEIPTGEKKEVRISGNDEFAVGDIVEFDEGQLLVRAYPKEYTGYNPSKYEIWFIDLNSYINPVEKSEPEITNSNDNDSGKAETPLSSVIPISALLTAGVFFLQPPGKNKK
ncbi:hypothetical protein L1994_00580 [Methanomicrobium antiquum]|uniref:Uncharacterized protein n=1 Tax=Methanomicrobium antiquum TaxID=487686 RepID=A0AAF0JM98_9EURY|nr:hypothetical protein [Methanomicrobium antiquum]MDD3978488.1 hypothetical protein [Methanomicrobium sp.]WFN36927.1 hypothetical protein L1994_00580 [Methanomicrobium antiquum]